jgi:hypothetical protein
MRSQERNTLLIEDARIIFRNFAGKEGKYNREGDRNFCVILEPELAEQLAQDGWNIKTLKPREEGDEETPYIQVSVGFKNRPPLMVMVTSRGRTTLTEEEVEIFDWVDIKTVDLILNPYEWLVNGKGGIKAYLKSMFVVIYEDELMLKYQDVPVIDGGSGRLAIESNKHYDLDGEVVEMLPASAGRIED